MHTPSAERYRLLEELSLRQTEGEERKSERRLNWIACLRVTFCAPLQPSPKQKYHRHLCIVVCMCACFSFNTPPHGPPASLPIHCRFSIMCKKNLFGVNAGIISLNNANVEGSCVPYRVSFKMGGPPNFSEIWLNFVGAQLTQIKVLGAWGSSKSIPLALFYGFQQP